MSGRTRRDQRAIIFARTRNRQSALREFNNIVCRTGCSSLTVLKILIERIKSF